MSRPARIGLAIVSFGIYLTGLAVAGMAVFLALVIGPFDGFAAGMIAVPGAIGMAGGAGVVRAAGPSRRGAAVFGLVLGVAWVAAAVWIVSLFASIGR
jgi:hypothetical protein